MKSQKKKMNRDSNNQKYHNRLIIYLITNIKTNDTDTTTDWKAYPFVSREGTQRPVSGRGLEK